MWQKVMLPDGTSDWMRVTLFQRRPQGSNFSIERVFADLRTALPDGVEAKVAISRFPSKGFFTRVYNTIEAAFRQADVNHITGDVHFLALLLQRRKTILTIHDLVTVHRLAGLKRWLFLFFWYWLPIRRSSLVTVISNSTKEELLAHIKIDPRKVRVIHDCVSAAFRPFPKKFNDAKPQVLQVGVGVNKNIERIARALRGVPCHWRVLGRLSAHQAAFIRECGIEYSSIADLASEEVVEEYHKCDMLVFASTYEGFGLPIVEAQATGRPVVTSNVYSMPEVAGDAACLVDPFDPEDIRRGIVRVVEDRPYREGLIARGLQNVERFRAGAIARQYVETYRKLLGEAA